MKLILQKAVIVHFKGIKELSIDFDPSSQNIWGDNATGKTSIADAISWCLFGKNSAGEADFNIKPLDKDNVRIPKTETDVTLHALVDKRKIVLRHVYKEKWEKKKGSAVAELAGNTHDYFVDSAPHTLAEYKAVINRLIDEDIFPLITNPLHFNRLPWQKRRGALMEIGGDISNSDLAATDPSFEPLIEILSNKTLAKYKQEVNAKKKIIKEELEGIPNRIDEVRRGTPEPLDYEAIQAQIESRNEALAAIDQEMTDTTKAAEAETAAIRTHQAKVRALKLDLDTLAFGIRARVNSKYSDSGNELAVKKKSLENAERDVTAAQNSIDSNERRKNDLTTQMTAGRDEWKKINSDVMPEFDQASCTCPVCKQDLPEEKIETLKADFVRNFNEDKARRLKNNAEKGIGLKKELDSISTILAARNQELTQHKDIYDALVDDIRSLEAVPTEEKPDVEMIVKSNVEHIALVKKIAALEADAPTENKQDLTDQRLKKQAIHAEMDAFKKNLNTREQIKAAEDRIAVLSRQEEDLAQQLVTLEGQENLIERFTKAKIDTLSDRINNKFQLVKFKMFNYLQNGGVEEACEAMVNGVPFSDLNTASKINAGIDVINVLCDHYGVKAPIVIDNKESVVKLLPTESQVINLIVKEGVKALHFGKNPPPVMQPQAELAL